MTLLLWFLVALLSLFFLFTGSIKAFGQPSKLFDYQFETYFKKFGIGRGQVRLIGFAELFGAIAIWFQQSIVGQVGLATLIIVTLGAIFFHFSYGSVKDAIPAIVMLILSSVTLTIVL